MADGGSLAGHYTILVYPFRHGLAGKQRHHRVIRLEARWQPWWRRLGPDDLRTMLDDTYFFLPHVRELLFPETVRLPGADPVAQAPAAQRLAELSLATAVAEVPADAVLRLTYDPVRLAELHPLQLEHARDGFSAPVTVAWVDALLFPQQIGFLAIRVELPEAAPSLQRINDLHYYLRLVHAKLGWELATWRRTAVVGGSPFSSRDFVDFLLHGMTDVSDWPLPTADGFPDRPGATPPGARFSTTEFGQAYGNVFHRYAYGCLAEAPPALPEDALPVAAPEGFGSAAERALYYVATATDPSDPAYVPHPAYLADLLERCRITLWNNWQRLALQNATFFLGTQDTRAVRETLAHNLEADYFHLFLLVLYQRMRLSLLQGQLIRRTGDLQPNLDAARHLLDEFTVFRNHYWASEVTRTPLSMEIYRRYQQGQEVGPLFDEVRLEMESLHGYYERRGERRTSLLLNLLTFVGLPAGLLAELFSNALIKEATWTDFFGVAAIFYALAVLGWLAWHRRLRLPRWRGFRRG